MSYRGLFWSTLLLFTHILPSLAGEVTEVVNRADILAYTGASDTIPRGMTALSDGRVAYFEDKGSGTGSDSVILIDPSQQGNNRFSIIASEYQLRSLSNQTVYGAHVSDMVRDANDNIYLIVCAYYNGGNNYDNMVVRIPSQGNGFGTPELVVDVHDGGWDGGSQRAYHRIALEGDKVLVLYDSRDTNRDLTGLAGDHGIYVFDLNEPQPAALSELDLLTPYTAIAAALDPIPEQGEAIGIWQIRGDGNGNLVAHVYEHEAGTPGDLLRIDANSGAVSLLLSQADAEIETGMPEQFRDETNLAIDPSTGDLYLFETGSGENRETLHRFDNNALQQQQLASSWQIQESVPATGDILTTNISNAMDLDDAGNVYVFLNKDGHETLIKVSPDSGCPAEPDYLWPTQDGSAPWATLASPYGPRQLPSDDNRYDFHRGIDIDMPIGTPVYAVEEGTVYRAGNVNGFDEPVVIIRHRACAPHTYSYYLHLTSASVQEGAYVSRGDQVGTSGKSSSDYQHLHFEMRQGGIHQSHCRNPFEYLPYTNTQPASPELVGVNQDGGGKLFMYRVTTADEEMDINSMTTDWGNDHFSWNWPDANWQNGPNFPEDMDLPVIEGPGSVFAVCFPEPMNDDLDHMVYHMAVANLDPSGVSGTVAASDIWGGTGQLQVSTPNQDLEVTPAAQTVNGTPGNNVVIDQTLHNAGGTSLTIQLSARSARNNTVTLSHTQVNLAAGASQAITLTVSLDNDDVEDGILLRAAHGANLETVTLTRIQTQ